MKFTNAKAVIAVLAIVLITSGCLENGDDDIEGDAVEVTNFQADPSPALSGQNVSFRLFLENAGEAEAQSVSAELSGPQIVEGDERTWSVADGTQAVMEFGDLTPSDEGGAPRNDDVVLTAPELDRDIPYDFDTSIIYGYETEGSMTVEAVGQSELQDRGEQPGPITVSESRAPIGFNIEGGRTPIEITDEEGTTSESVCINVVNSGLGTAFSPDEVEEADTTDDVENENVVNLTLENVGAFTWEDSEGGEFQDEVDLFTRDGMVQGTECYDLNVDNEIVDLEGTTVSIGVEAEYGYIDEELKSILVEER